MSVAPQTQFAPFGAITVFALVNRIEQAKEALVKWNTCRQTYSALSKLSNRELDDIGLVRGDVDEMATRF